MTLLLIAVVITLIILLIIQYAQLKYYKTTYKNTSVLGILQKMFQELGANNKTSVQKLEDINLLLAEYFGTKFSTIAWYNGSTFEVKASNVTKNYYQSIIESISTKEYSQALYNNVSKYLTAQGTQTLSYNTAIERGIKSAMLSPLFSNDTFVGFWFLEDEEGNAYDTVQKEHLANIKNNLSLVLENTNSQQIIENLAQTDQDTGFKNRMYLYTSSRVKMNDKDISSIALMDISNFRELNNKYGRVDGDKALIALTEIIKEMFTGDVEYIRYGSDQFAVVCFNTEASNIYGNIERVKSKLLISPLVLSDGSEYVIKIGGACINYRRLTDLDKIMQNLSNAVEKSKSKDSIEIVE